MSYINPHMTFTCLKKDQINVLTIITSCFHKISNGYFDNSQRDYRYESLQPVERTRVGQSHEDMV